MHDKDGHWYKNEMLIERLDITINEQKQLKTIIRTEINNKRRRNEEGPTKKEKNLNNTEIEKSK